MFNWRQNPDGMSLQSKLDALDRSQAVIEFKPDGTIVSANANFLNAMGYSLVEIQGKHHSMFVEPSGARRRRLSRILGGSEARRIPGGRIQADRQGRQGRLDPGDLQPGARSAAATPVKGDQVR